MRLLALAALAFGLAAPAVAHDQCPAPGRHEKFGEQRAYFQDVLGACRADGFCSAVVATKSKDGAAWAEQLRIAQPTPGAAFVMSVATTTAMPAPAPTTQLRAGKLSLAAQVNATAGNEFTLTHAKETQALVAAARASRSLLWTFANDKGGLEAAEFSLRGMAKALDWIACMGKPKSAALPEHFAWLDYTIKGSEAATSKRFQAELRRRYGQMTNAAAIASDLQYQGLDCQEPSGQPGALDCQRVRQAPGEAPCFDVWRASFDPADTPAVQGDYARRCTGALPPPKP
ncbi:MAG: hypothetical protein ACOYJ6_12685 [Caulobacterales bacterium]